MLSETNSTVKQGIFSRLWWESQWEWIYQFERKVVYVQTMRKKVEERREFFIGLAKLGCIAKLVYCHKAKRHLLAFKLSSLVQAGLLSKQGKLPSNVVIKKVFLKGIEEKTVPYVKVSFVKRLVAAKNRGVKNSAA